MNITSWKYCNQDDLPTSNYDYIFISSYSDLDERSKWCKFFCQSTANTLVLTKYVKAKSDCDFSLKGEVFDLSEISPAEKILVEATTLDFVELLFVIKNLKDCGLNFDIFYVEPTNYSRPSTTVAGNQKFYYISDYAQRLDFIPRFTCPSKPSRALFISLGFEGHRFGAILESEEYEISKYHAFVGVPAFNLGMEKESYKANLKYLSETNAKIHFAAANDPIETLKRLEYARDSVRYEDRVAQSTPIILAPFGSKPANIGLIFFALENDAVGIIYDYARRKNGRSEGIGKCHIWTFLNS